MHNLSPNPDLAAAPEGFEPIQLGGAFVTFNGPIHARWRDERLQLGFRVAPHQANPANGCHGGMLATFADILLSTAAHYQCDIPRQFLPTVSLQIDFMASSPMGSWVQGHADILKVSRNLIFSQAIVTADGVPAIRASGVFKRGPLLPDTAHDPTLKLPGLPRR